MHFKRRSPSSAAHGYGSLKREDDKHPEFDGHGEKEPSVRSEQAPAAGARQASSQASSFEPRREIDSVSMDDSDRGLRQGLSRPKMAEERSRSREMVVDRALRDRGPNGAPRGDVWEQSFSMSPDVRFTRTPERVLKERRMQTTPQSTPDVAERQAKEIASVRAADPAPAVQERLLALQTKAASQEVGNGAPRAFTRTPSHAPDQVKRAVPVRPRGEAPQRNVPVAAEPVAASKAIEQAVLPATSSPAPYELPAVQQ